MRVLITSAQRISGYALAAALRPHCSFLAVTLEQGIDEFARSRLYDEVATLPAVPLTEWIGVTTGAEVEAHARRVLEVCRTMKIDVVWPTSDPELFALSRFHDEFAAHGVRLLGPREEALLATADKARVLGAAQRAGFPVADTALCADGASIRAALASRSFPVVVKGRWSTGSTSVTVAWEYQQAVAAADELLSAQGLAIIQSYIAGGRERSFLYIAPSGGSPPLFAGAFRKLRHLGPSFSTAVDVIEPPPEVAAGSRLLTELGLSGVAVIQARLDPADGQHKLVEVNPRFGTNSRILFAMDRLLPWHATLAMSGRPEEASARLPLRPGLSGASPVEDVLSLWTLGLAKMVQRRRPAAELPRAIDYIASAWKFYRRGPAIDLHLRALLDDTRAALPYFRGLARYLPLTPSRRRRLDLVAWGESTCR